MAYLLLFIIIGMLATILDRPEYQPPRRSRRYHEYED